MLFVKWVGTEIDSARQLLVTFGCLVLFLWLDVAVAVLEHLYEAFGEKFKPCSIFVEKVKNGQLGIKTKKGFYEY